MSSLELLKARTAYRLSTRRVQSASLEGQEAAAPAALTPVLSAEAVLALDDANQPLLDWDEVLELEDPDEPDVPSALAPAAFSMDFTGFTEATPSRQVPELKSAEVSVNMESVGQVAPTIFQSQAAPVLPIETQPRPVPAEAATLTSAASAPEGRAASGLAVGLRVQYLLIGVLAGVLLGLVASSLLLRLRSGEHLMQFWPNLLMTSVVFVGLTSLPFTGLIPRPLFKQIQFYALLGVTVGALLALGLTGIL